MAAHWLILAGLAIGGVLGAAIPAHAQTVGSLEPKPLPPLASPGDPHLAAKELFGRKTTPSPAPARAIGFYARGCLAGAQALPVDGDTWQVMRLSRHRNWGHPDLIALLKRLSTRAKQDAGWNGLLVGDISQPRGGPMLTGHASHQVGLDADVWLTPMPNRQLTRSEREKMLATDMVRRDRRDIDPKAWSPSHLVVIRAAAREPRVERIFVNAAIKKALCREAKGDRGWLGKVRPAYGHIYHFHIRITCPAGIEGCTPQPPPDGSEGCRPDDLAYWFSDAVLHPKPPATPPKPRPPLTLADLPPACRQVVFSP